MEIVLAFITGLTAGGLSCAAVQGGLLMSGMAQQAQRDVKNHAPISYTPVSVFLIAKIAAYTLLGIVLGWAGSLAQLSPMVQGALFVFVALFMVGQALNLFDVHPFFRQFVIEPPEAVRRFIRKRAKQGSDELFSPAFMGVLTVLLPCGVTQVMMATALATGSPWRGAALMFAFTLGASPMFVALVVLARKLGSVAHERFMGAMAAVILAMGVLTLSNGLTLLGSPITLATLTEPRVLSLPAIPAAANESNFSPLPAADGAASSAFVGPVAPVGIIKMEIKRGEYEPAVLKARANTALKLEVKADSGFS